MEFIFEASIGISSELRFEVSHRNKKWELPQGNSHFLYLFDTIDVTHTEDPSYGFDLHFHSFGNENEGVAAVETGGQQHATGMLHLSGFESALKK